MARREVRPISELLASVPPVVVVVLAIVDPHHDFRTFGVEVVNTIGPAWSPARLQTGGTYECSNAIGGGSDRTSTVGRSRPTSTSRAGG